MRRLRSEGGRRPAIAGFESGTPADRTLGRLAEAEGMLREALGIHREVLPPNDHYIDASLNNLAICLIDQGRFEEAELLLTEVWDRISAAGSLHERGSCARGTDR